MAGCGGTAAPQEPAVEPERVEEAATAAEPIDEPTETPTAEPTVEPTEVPTAVPTASPAKVTYSMVFKLTNSPNNLKSPGGVAEDSMDNLFVWDAGRSRLLKFDSTGNLLESWENQAPAALVIDSAGGIYVSDQKTNSVQKIAVSQ